LIVIGRRYDSGGFKKAAMGGFIKPFFYGIGSHCFEKNKIRKNNSGTAVPEATEMILSGR
jgi:hypothetical protein